MASPTFQDSCFETEAEAEQFQSRFLPRDVDNSEVIKKDDRIRKLVSNDWEKVELALLKEILGEAENNSFYAQDEATLSWTLGLEYSPSAGAIDYEASRGYCVSTRRAPYGSIHYLWTPAFQGSTLGVLERRSTYS